MSDDRSRTAALEHAWNYFSLHATQRISVFNFYVASSGVVFAGLASTFQGSRARAMLGIGAGLLLSLLSFVFWKLDERTSVLIRHSEIALAEAERQGVQKGGRLFATEGRLRRRLRAGRGPLRRMWTYGELFRLIFLIVGLLGFGGACLSALRAAGLLGLI